ncbi:unnamed protein product [Gordionus sp. m RMFG-2023]|uniref:hsp90 co-chaperone Cdc37-like n=1 Tax=Gordionus sp. m RMFG-2023 TaxID=3053472 RepID=UPI0030E21283
MSSIDYSKWKDIEISDDEDDTHPNIDTPSLFRWRHQARVQRMEESEKEKENYSIAVKENNKKKLEIQDKMKDIEAKQLNDQENNNKNLLEDLAKKLKNIEDEGHMLKQKCEELEKKEKLAPWNVDTISKEGFTKTIINKPIPKEDKYNSLSEDEKAKIQVQFNKEHMKELKTLGLLHRWDDTKAYLTEHPELVCEETSNFFVIWCIDLEVEEKHELMAHVAHQTITMQYLLELAKKLEVNPKAVVSSFFTKIKLADKEYMDTFNDELEAFKQRVKDRARIRIEKAIKELEEEERQKRLGPGGLDPVEVMEQLPKEMQECFEKQDTQLLKKFLPTIERAEAERLMKLCVDSGLWVPDANQAKPKAEDSGDAEKEP